MKRLVRGLGASTSESRTGFYSTLVAFLSSSRNIYPQVATLFELMETTLSVGGGSHLEKVSGFLLFLSLRTGLADYNKKILN